MKDVIEYLQEKIDKTSIGGNVQFSAPTIIKYNILNGPQGNTLEDFVSAAIQQVLVSTMRSEVAGIAKLTKASTSIGGRIFRMMGRDDEPFHHRVRMGDLFVEGLLQQGYIDVYRDPSFAENAVKAPYILQLESKWSEISDFPLVKDKESLRGTSFIKPEPVTKKVIKRNRMSNEEWNHVKESQHIAAVNKLMAVPYQVNMEVLDTVKANRELFVTTDKIQIPKAGNKAAMERAYSKMRYEINRSKDETSEDVKKVKKAYEREALKWNAKLQALKAQSKRTAHEYTIQKASLLRDEPEFYQLIELDYRGRFYYTESFFNFQGTDVARGIMQFANGVQMDATGERYLAIHTASCYNESYSIDEIPVWCKSDYRSYLQSEGLDSISVDKMTLDDREMWTRMNLIKIVEYANNNEIKMEAEKPVGFLACCYEWRKYLANPDTHLTHLPIQIDGSNNGWQHLGAMSKDEHTGELVGLIPQDIQKDFYVQTAKKTVAMMPEWFEEKKMPMKHIRKGISKRGSMTRAYSAGEKTMGINMYADCHQEGFTEKYGITIEDCNNLSHKLIQAINEVCPGPLRTMSYLQKLAQYELGTYKWFDANNKVADKKYKSLKKERKSLLYKKDKDQDDLERLNELSIELGTYTSKLVRGNGKNTISWTTPSGFKVNYRCFTTRQLSAKGNIKGIGRIEHRGVEETDFPDARGYASGISPNFVHSMDGSHMAIVVDNWDRDFAAVHDAFAVHAPLVGELLHITKEAFIAIYDVDNFYDYIEETILSSTDNLDLEQPLIGNLSIEDVRDSDYFFA